MNITNYRPITILSAIPKLLEKVKYDQLYGAFSPIFSTNISGFLCGHSCCSALIKMSDDWHLALDRKKNIGTVAVDLAKAFDSICHNLLLANLRAYGVSDTAVQFQCSYLDGASNESRQMVCTLTGHRPIVGFLREVCWALFCLTSSSMI